MSTNLVAVLVPAAAGIVGVLLGGYVQRNADRKRLALEIEDRYRTTLRTEKLLTYKECLSNAIELQTSVREFLCADRLGLSSDAQEVDIEAAEGQVRSSLQRLKLLGSQAVIRAYSGVEEYKLAEHQDGSKGILPPEIAIDDLEKSIERLVTAMREDLDSPPKLSSTV